MHNFRTIFISMLLLLTGVVHSESAYVIDELKIGLHEAPTIDSPIIKLVPSGTELTVIDRQDDLLHVDEPEGARGWINDKYVVADKPGRARVKELEKEIESLKSAAANTVTVGDGSDAQKELEQQLKSERLKSGSLQAKLTDLKAKIASVDNSGQFIADIEQLKEENEQLKSQLQSSGIEVEENSNTTNKSFISLSGWKQILIALAIILVIGMAAGAFILDHLNRRRHGGFRV